METWREELYAELYHHGIKGQKWGIRKYQNEDGTLTEEGRQRYLYDNMKKSERRRYENNNLRRKDVLRINKRLAKKQSESGMDEDEKSYEAKITTEHLMKSLNKNKDVLMRSKKAETLRFRGADIASGLLVGLVSIPMNMLGRSVHWSNEESRQQEIDRLTKDDE